MGLDKAIKQGREWRKQYRKRPQKVDRTCRNHGTCSWCRENRLHKFNICDQKAKYREVDVEFNEGA